jgi:hypothetical protein
MDENPAVQRSLSLSLSLDHTSNFSIVSRATMAPPEGWGNNPASTMKNLIELSHGRVATGKATSYHFEKMTEQAIETGPAMYFVEYAVDTRHDVSHLWRFQRQIS